MRRFLLLAVPLLLGGCATRMMPSGEVASVAPMLSVERFLQASNDRDIYAMARLFGTEDGPIGDTGSAFGCGFKKLGSWFGLGSACVTQQEVELRMDAIAQLLRHDDYTIVSERSMAGRHSPTSRIGVNIVIEGDTISDVPFVVVRTGEGRWLVEEIGLAQLTGR